MADAVVRCLRDGRLDGEHTPALAMQGSLQCCPLAARTMLHLAAAVASNAAVGKAQARGVVVVAFDRSPEVYLDFMRRSGLDSNALGRCVRILDCYLDPLGWKQNIRIQSHQEDTRTPCSKNKDNITIFRSVKDVAKLLCSIIDLGRGFDGESKTYFSVAVDSISTMLRYASLQPISSLLSNLQSHDQISLILWLMHLDLHEPKFSRAFECLSTMVACVEIEVADSGYGEERRGNLSFLEHNYSKAKFHVRLKRRNGRVKHLYEELHVEGYDVKFVSASSLSSEVNQNLVPKVQFNLELSEKERSDRANVVLPFEHQDLMRTAVYHEEENLIELRLEVGSLWINETVIQHVLDMPRGSDKEPQASEAEVEEEYRSMSKLLHAVSSRYPEEYSFGEELEDALEKMNARGRRCFIGCLLVVLWFISLCFAVFLGCAMEAGKSEPIRIYDGRRSLLEAQQYPNLTTAALLDETKVPKSATSKGEIHYIRDSDDERPDSDEDPDDDLDI